MIQFKRSRKPNLKLKKEPTESINGKRNENGDSRKSLKNLKTLSRTKNIVISYG